MKSFMACSAMLACLVAASVGAADESAPNGLALYFARQDSAAIAALAAEAPPLPIARTLALADLYFMNGRTGAARRTLLDALEREPLDDLAIWLAWMELADRRAHDAGRILADIAATGTESSAPRAAFSLAWQLWLGGDTRAAAEAFARVSAEPTLPQLADAAQLLRGEALMLAHDYERAEDALRRVGTASLVGDAARDLAWIRFRRGEVAAARADLDALAARGDHAGTARLDVPWPHVLRHGPHALAKRWQRGYRDRPRGQDPTVFLLDVADRDASVDADAMLRAFFPSEAGDGGGRDGASVGRRSTAAVPAADGSAPARVDATRPGRDSLRTSAGRRFRLTALLALLALLAALVVAHRRAGSRR